MTRLAIAFVAAGLVLGCGGKHGTTTTTSGTGTPIVPRRAVVTWGIQPATGGADVFLALTDETGKQVSHPLGHWPGTCALATPAATMNALSGVDCKTGGTGTELQVVVHGGDQLVVLKLTIDEGVTPDPMAREEVTRIQVPLGAKIESGN